MNKKGLEEFFSFVATNRDLQEQVKGLGGDVDALAAFAKERGYDVSPEELRSYTDGARELLKSKLQQAQRESGASQSPGVKAFFALMKLGESDDEVGKRLEELSGGTAEELIAYGAELGFLFSREDMLDIGKDILEPSDELSDEEMERVAGGVIDLTSLAVVFAGIGLSVALAGGVGVAAGVGAVAGFVLGVTALAK